MLAVPLSVPYLQSPPAMADHDMLFHKEQSIGLAEVMTALPIIVKQNYWGTSNIFRVALPPPTKEYLEALQNSNQSLQEGTQSKALGGPWGQAPPLPEPIVIKAYTNTSNTTGGRLSGVYQLIPIK